MKLNKQIIIILIGVFLLNSFKNKEITWVAIGDSITYLNDHLDETGGRVTKGYLTSVIEYFPHIRYINKGYNGWSSGNIASHIDDLDLVKADVYSVFLGTNDWWQGRPLGQLQDYQTNQGNATVYGSFRIIVDKLRKLNPQAKLLFITPMQRADFVYINDAKNNAFGSYKTKNGRTLEAIATAIVSIGEYANIPVVDLYHHKQLPIKRMVNFKRLKDPHSGLYRNYKYPKSNAILFSPLTDEYPYPTEAINLTYDGLHPSDKGNAIISKAIISRFKHMNLIGTHSTMANAEIATNPWNKYIDIKSYVKPFWATDTITDETVQVIRKDGLPTATLLFDAKRIISVKSADFNSFYEKGRDWDLKRNKLIFGPRSRVPFFHPDDLVFNKKLPGASMTGKEPGTYVLFKEGPYFSSRQISVTYIKEHDQAWKGPTPQYAAVALPNSITKLQNRQKFKIVFYGNSIEVGYNASGLEKVPPFMPVWPELVVRNLIDHYSGEISFVNTSVAGRLAQWGVDSAEAKVVLHEPDLVIIGFGMNDGTMKVPGDKFREQIQRIIDAVKAKNSSVEFILISPMLANPASGFDGLQSTYKSELDKLTREGVVLADMTGVHLELLKYKSYQDMTGNNINHPNDYLARWYAQFISGFFIK